MAQPNWIPDGVEVDRPNVARMWDYFLGGAHNFAADRAAARQAIEFYPDLPLVAQVTRGFLRRVVNVMVDQGVGQFLDLGAGIPTVGSVHEIAQRRSASARVAYVDMDPVAVAHSEAILTGTTNTVAVLADARRPAEIVQHPDIRRILDWTQPICVLAIALFHFIPDDLEALKIIQTISSALPNGSYLALTHASADRVESESVVRTEQLYERTGVPFRFRTREQIASLFRGFDLIEPGVVYVPRWRPETGEDPLLDQADRASAYAGVARKA
jgi:hypothetical protein